MSLVQSIGWSAYAPRCDSMDARRHPIARPRASASRAVARSRGRIAAPIQDIHRRALAVISSAAGSSRSPGSGRGPSHETPIRHEKPRGTSNVGPSESMTIAAHCDNFCESRLGAIHGARGARLAAAGSRCKRRPTPHNAASRASGSVRRSSPAPSQRDSTTSTSASRALSGRLCSAGTTERTRRRSRLRSTSSVASRAAASPPRGCAQPSTGRCWRHSTAGRPRCSSSSPAGPRIRARIGTPRPQQRSSLACTTTLRGLRPPACVRGPTVDG